MLNNIRPTLRLALAGVALGAIIPLAACNQAYPEQQAKSAYNVPDLPATLPLALGEERPVTYAPAVQNLPAAKPIKASRVSNPDDYYAWADDAWGYYDTLGDAPPDYGFYYDDVEPWAWQGYDDSMMFVEPLDAGYRYYYYRPGEPYPYFVRDPYYGYGYDDGLLAVVYNALGGIVPYDDYYDEPYLDYASRYYDRGYRLYSASRVRHPVIALNWYDVQPSYNLAFLDWEDDLWRQPDWWDYHERSWDSRELYWRDERARREAEAVRYAAWRDLGFQTLPPARAIPSNWQRADWARNERWYEPAVSGFEGGQLAEQRAVRRERQRVASLARDAGQQDQVRLASLRTSVEPRPDLQTRRVERLAERRRTLKDRQVQVASRNDQSSRRERAVLERQERTLARAQQGEIRRERGVDAQRTARVERQQLREAAREQRVNQTERGRQDGQARLEQRQQRDEQRVEAQQRRQAQIEVRAQGQRRQEVQAQARAEAQQQRAVRDQAAQQRRAVQEQARQQRTQANAQAVQREQARQAAQQQRAAREQARQQQSQARQAAEQQRAAREQARQQQVQAAEQQRASRDQARQQQQAQAQARQQAAQQQQAQAQARQQAAQEQRAASEQAKQAAQQQRVAQAEAAQPGNGKEKRGRGQN